MELKKTSKADLQNKKLLFFEISLCLALAATLAAFEWSSSKSDVLKSVAERQGIVIEDEMVPVTQQTPPRPQEIPKIPQLVEQFVITDEEIKFDSDDFKEDENNTNLYDALVYIGKTRQELKTEVEIEDDEIPFVAVKNKPKFQGRDASEFRKWINEQINKKYGGYPPLAQENNIQGTVMVAFTVMTDGRLADIRVVRKVDPVLADVVLEIVKQSPKWTPGSQQDRVVKVTYQVPVVFKLNN